MTACLAWCYALFADRTRRRLELALSPPAMGVVSLPVKMQSVVRALTADTLSFGENTLSTIVRVGRKAAGRTHDRPRRTLAVVIAELESGDVTTVRDLLTKADVAGHPIPRGQKARATATGTGAWTRRGMTRRRVC